MESFLSDEFGSLAVIAAYLILSAFSPLLKLRSPLLEP